MYIYKIISICVNIGSALLVMCVFVFLRNSEYCSQKRYMHTYMFTYISASAFMPVCIYIYIYIYIYT